MYVNGHVGAGERAGVRTRQNLRGRWRTARRRPFRPRARRQVERPHLRGACAASLHGRGGSPHTPELMARALASYTKQAAAAGNTTLHEPGTIKPEWVEALAKLSNTLAVRMSASFSTDASRPARRSPRLDPAPKARKIPDSRFSLYGMKFWADGSNQAERAAQTKPYLNSTKRAGPTTPCLRWRNCAGRRRTPGGRS